MFKQDTRHKNTAIICCILSEMKERKVQLFGFPPNITEVRVVLHLYVPTFGCHGDGLEPV